MTAALPIDLDRLSSLIGRDFQPYERAIILGLISGRPILWHGLRSGKTRLAKEAVRVLRGYDVNVVVIDEYPFKPDTPHPSLPTPILQLRA